MLIDPLHLIEHIDKLLGVFSDVWGVMCKPFIGAVVGSNPHNAIVFSYVTPVIVIGLAFCSIALTKKLIILFLGGDSSW